MADLSAIKSEINTDIVTNGVNAITADKLNDVLIDLCDAMETTIQDAEDELADAVDMVNEINISKVYTNGGTNNSNEYTLANAIGKVPNAMQVKGCRITFLSDGTDSGLTEGVAYTYQYTGNTFANENCWTQVGVQTSNKVADIIGYDHNILTKKGYYSSGVFTSNNNARCSEIMTIPTGASELRVHFYDSITSAVYGVMLYDSNDTYVKQIEHTAGWQQVDLSGYSKIAFAVPSATARLYGFNAEFHLVSDIPALNNKLSIADAATTYQSKADMEDYLELEITRQYTAVTPTENNNYVNTTTGLKTSTNTNYLGALFAVSPNTSYYIKRPSLGNNSGLCLLDSNNSFSKPYMSDGTQYSSYSVASANNSCGVFKTGADTAYVQVTLALSAAGQETIQSEGYFLVASEVAIDSLKEYKIPDDLTEELAKVETTPTLPFRKTILVTGASIAMSSNNAFEYAAQKLAADCINRAVSGSTIADACHALWEGSLFTDDEIDAADVLILSHTHNQNIMDETNLLESVEDYEAAGYFGANYDSDTDKYSYYPEGFDYFIKKWKQICYNKKFDSTSRYYGSKGGKPFVVAICSYWHDAYTTFNTAAQQFAEKWGLLFIDQASNIGFSKDDPIYTSDTIYDDNGNAISQPVQVSVLHCENSYGNTETIDGVVYGYHPTRTDSTGYGVPIQKRRAAIIADYLNKILL